MKPLGDIKASWPVMAESLILIRDVYNSHPWMDRTSVCVSALLQKMSETGMELKFQPHKLLE